MELVITLDGPADQRMELSGPADCNLRAIRDALGIKIVARDLPHFQEIVQSKLLRCAAIQHMESSIVLEHLKDTTELPLDD